MMRKSLNITFLAAAFLFFLLPSCTQDDEEELTGNWVELSELNGDSRSSAVAFVIGGTAYVGTGLNDSEDDYYSDFWTYNQQLNFWQKLTAEFPGVARSSAVAFTIDGKGYVGTGFDGDDELADFWQFDPDSETPWTRKADFGGGIRSGAVGFSLNGKGYIGTGYNGSDQKDIWQYDPNTDTWTEIPSFGGSKRKDAVAFVIDNVAYVGTGLHNGAYENDLWALNGDMVGSEEYPWEQLTDLDDEDEEYDILRSGAVAFTLNNRGYIATGYQGYITSTVWEYVPGTDVWTELYPFEGSSRIDAVAFTINERAFIALGRNGSSYFDDTFEFKPTEDYDEED